MPVLRRQVSTAFARIAKWRGGARASHPRGTLFDARVALTDRASATATALGGTGERRALVRLSKGAGTPGALPDLLGVAVRVEVGGGLLDVLFTSGGRRGPARRLLAPSTGWGRRPYTTLLPYAAAGTRVVLGLEPDAAPQAFTLTEQERRGPPRPIGRLVLEGVHTGDPVAFDPLRNAHSQLRPAPPLRRLRAWAYRASRRGRGADPGELDRGP